MCFLCLRALSAKAMRLKKVRWYIMYYLRSLNNKSQIPGTRLYLAVPGFTWLLQAVLGCTWLYLAVLGSNWAGLDCTRLYLAVIGYQAVTGCTRLYLALHGCT